MASPESARTAATLYLTLTLVRSQYPSITAAHMGMAVIPIPGVLKYGDGSTADSSERLMIQRIDDDSDYIIATASLLHTYPNFHHYGNPWWAEFEYCCKAKSLQNNMETLFSLRTGVDLTYSWSPLLPTIPMVTFIRSPVLQQFFFTAHHPEAHPLLYSFGTPLDYRSSQSGTPHGLRISYTTGLVTWNTSHVTPGSYSVQIVVLDAFTNIRVSSRDRESPFSDR